MCVYFLMFRVESFTFTFLKPSGAVIVAETDLNLATLWRRLKMICNLMVIFAVLTRVIRNFFYSQASALILLFPTPSLFSFNKKKMEYFKDSIDGVLLKCIFFYN